MNRKPWTDLLSDETIVRLYRQAVYECESSTAGSDKHYLWLEERGITPERVKEALKREQERFNHNCNVVAAWLVIVGSLAAGGFLIFGL